MKDLSSRQFQILEYLSTNSIDTLQPLADHLGVSVQCISGTVARLIYADVITRKPFTLKANFIELVQEYLLSVAETLNVKTLSDLRRTIRRIERLSSLQPKGSK